MGVTPGLAPTVAAIPAVARAYGQTVPPSRVPSATSATTSAGSGSSGGTDARRPLGRVISDTSGFEPFVRSAQSQEPSQASAVPTARSAFSAPAERAAVGPALGTRVQIAPVDEAARHSLESELASIKSLVSEVLEVTRRGDARPAGTLNGRFAEVVRTLERQGVSRFIIDEVVAGAERRTERRSGAASPDSPECMSAALAELAALVPIASAPTPPKRRAAGPFTIALIGPTGVGKTTTIAKLAAEYSLRAGLRVGLIAADTYRIAAVDQLRTYASIIDVPLVVASGAEQIPGALAELAACDVILLDTAGRSQRDSERLEELASTLDAASPDRTHLVLSGTGAESVVMDAMTRFGAMNPSSIIFTKLDEAVQIGMLVNVATVSRLGISFLTTGQDVPDNIEPASGERLASLVLEADGVGAGSSR